MYAEQEPQINFNIIQARHHYSYLFESPTRLYKDSQSNIRSTLTHSLCNLFSEKISPNCQGSYLVLNPEPDPDAIRDQ
jgi:hypothetical protein